MACFGYVTTLAGASLSHLAGITDLEIQIVNGGWYLYSATGIGGGLTAFGLSDGAAAVAIDQMAFYPGLGAQSQTVLGLLNVSGAPVLIAGGRMEAALEGMRLGADGGFAATTAFTGDSAFLGDMVRMISVTVGGTGYLYAAGGGAEGLGAYRMGAGYSVTYLGAMPDAPDRYGADVSAMASMVKGGATYLFAASAFEDGITSYRIGADGRLTLAGIIGAAQGMGLDAPTAIEAVHFGGHGYVVVAGGGSSSLTVLRVNQQGKMWVADHVPDQLETRFDAVAALETIMVKGRLFVLAGGGDDGISAFELIWGGNLRHIDSFADTAASALSNVTAIAAALVGTDLQVFAAGEGEAGISQFTLDLGRIDAPIYGTGGADDLRGSSRNDLIHGKAGADFLKGNFGDDVLVDGAGSDVMTGGPGADVFIFDADGESDKIMDFTPGLDKIDLSAWTMLYGIGQLTFVESEAGLRIRFGDERIVLQGEGGQPVLADDLGAQDFIFI